MKLTKAEYKRLKKISESGNQVIRLRLHDEGDPSVGIFGGDSEVEITVSPSFFFEEDLPALEAELKKVFQSFMDTGSAEAFPKEENKFDPMMADDGGWDKVRKDLKRGNER